jgi:uncharacterized membrane protein YsdA (DUF1294 family)
MKDLNILHIVLIYLGIINVVTFFMYGIDKWKAVSQREKGQTRLNSAERKQLRPKVKAKKSKMRIRETALLGLAVLGGSIGAWLGMKVWHHKTLHKKFRFGVPAIIIIQLLLIGYLLYKWT